MFHLSLLFFGTLYSNGYIFPFLLCFWLLFFSQLSVRPPQTAILLFCQGPGVCKLPKPPASRALCQAKRAPRAAFPSGCLAAQTKRWAEGIRVPVRGLASSCLPRRPLRGRLTVSSTLILQIWVITREGCRQLQGAIARKRQPLSAGLGQQDRPRDDPPYSLICRRSGVTAGELGLFGSVPEAERVRERGKFLE